MEPNTVRILAVVALFLLIGFIRPIIVWVAKTGCKNCGTRIWRWHIIHCKHCHKSSCHQCAKAFGPGESFKGKAVRCPVDNCGDVILL